MHSERQHKKYSPSQADTFFVCHGAPNLVARLPPRVPTEWAIEGTKAHEVLEAGLRNHCQNATQSIDNSIHCCEEFGIEFKASVNDALDYIYNTIDDLTEKFGPGVQLFIEQPIYVPIESFPGEADGHADIGIYHPRGRILYVVDYKHGAGVAKAVVGNRQVKQYASGFLFGPQALIPDTEVDQVVLVIVQPRAFHPDGDIREFRLTPAEVWDYIMELDAMIEVCEQPDAPLVPGEQQCQFCDGRSSCPALEAKSLSVINPEFKSIRDVTTSRLPDPKSLDIERLAYVKQSFTLLKTWMKGVDTHLDELLRSGQHVPHYKLVETQARREWHGEEAERVKHLAAIIGCTVDELYHTEMKPITEIEEMIVAAFKDRVSRKNKRKAAEEANQSFAYFTTKKSSGTLTLVHEDDPRPAVNLALTHFGGLGDKVISQTSE